MMKLKEHLIVRMGRAMRDRIAAQVMQDDALYSQLLLLVKSGSQTQRMKGSWVLSGIHKMDSERIEANYSLLLDCLKTETVGGVKRELLRCFEGATLNEDVADQLVLITMKWVVDEHQDLAVRYLCHRLLKPLLKHHKELQCELNNQVELYRLKNGRFP